MIVSGRLRQIAAACSTAIIVVLGVACAPLRPAQPWQPADQTIVLISLDGFHPDYLTQHSPPTLMSLAATGVRAQWMTPSFPTVTFPNHYAIVTGLRPQNHGIVHNTMFDPRFNARFAMGNPESFDGRWWGGEPIWVTAERQGVRSAAFFWPGTEVEIDGVRPSRWLRYDDDIAYETRVDSVLTWLSLRAGERPRMVTLYFSEPDHAGHEDGPNSPAVRAAVLKVDSALARLVNGLRERGLYDSVNLIIVSDHGMAETSVDRVVYVADVIDTARVRVTTSGANLMGSSRTGNDAEFVAALRRLPHVQAWLREDVPERFHFRNHARIGPVVALADEGWRIYTARGGRVTSGGAHGYDNALASMRAIFIARGPAFRAGITLPPFDNVDVYPLMMHILGLQQHPGDGSLTALRAALR